MTCAAGELAGGGGFLDAAPDLYYWGSRPRCLWTVMREVTAGTGRTVAAADARRRIAAFFSRHLTT